MFVLFFIQLIHISLMTIQIREWYLSFNHN